MGFADAQPILRISTLNHVMGLNTSGAGPTITARAFAADLLQVQQSEIFDSIQFMIVVNCKRGGLRLGHAIGAEQRVGKYLAQSELKLALPVQLSAIVSR
jgi:hypothetical protein